MGNSTCNPPASAVTQPENLELVGVHEAAELLGISKSALSERRRAGTFADPVAELACGPIWRRTDIEMHAAEYRRRPGGWQDATHRHLIGPNYGGYGREI